MNLEDHPKEEKRTRKEKEKKKPKSNLMIIDMEVIKPIPKSSFEDLKQAAKVLPKMPDSKLIDPMSFYKTIVWSKDMVEKYDYETIKELVEIFYLLGYITERYKRYCSQAY